MKRFAVAAVLIGIAFIACGCSASDDLARVSMVTSAVERYNTALARGLSAMDMNELNSVATRDQAYTEYFQMSALGESGVRMMSRLTSIEFGEVTFSGDSSATVETTETWEYEHISLETSETVRTEKGVIYRLRYELVMQEDRWLVDRVTSLDSPDEAPAGGE